MVLVLATACSPGLSGTYVAKGGPLGGSQSYEFKPKGVLTMRSTIFGMTSEVEATWTREGDEVKVTMDVQGSKASLVGKVREDGCLDFGGPVDEMMVYCKDDGSK